MKKSWIPTFCTFNKNNTQLVQLKKIKEIFLELSNMTTLEQPDIDTGLDGKTIILLRLSVENETILSDWLAL